MREVNQPINLVCISRSHADAAFALLKRNLLANEQGPPRKWLFDDPGALDNLGKIFRRSIHDGDLEVINLYKNIINAEPTQGRQQMFYGREHYTGAHERRCIATVSDGLNGCRNLEATKVRATEYITGIRRCRNETHMDRHGGMQTHTMCFYRNPQSSLFDQDGKPFNRKIDLEDTSK